MSNTTVKVPPALDALILRLHVKKKSRHKALKHLTDLALGDKATFKSPDHFGPPAQDSKSCTVNFSDAEYDKTEKYRDKYTLLTRIAFLRYALVHGGTLFQAQLQAEAENAAE